MLYLSGTPVVVNPNPATEMGPLHVWLKVNEHQQSGHPLVFVAELAS